MKNETSEITVSTFERAWVKAASLVVVALRWPVAALTGRAPDPWRRVVGLGLRSDGTKFGLSAFSLDLFSDLPQPERIAPTRSTAEGGDCAVFSAGRIGEDRTCAQGAERVSAERFRIRKDR